MPVCGIGMVAVIGTATLWSVPGGSALSAPLIALAFCTFGLVIVRGILVTSRAMMARMRSEAGLADRNEMVRLLLSEFESNGSDWLIEVDAEGRLTHVSPRLADVAARPRAELLGKSLLDLLGDERRGKGRSSVKALTGAVRGAAGVSGYHHPGRMSAAKRAGGRCRARQRPMRMGQFAGYRGVGRDVTEARRSHDRIVELARYDPLTGLANRALFRESAGRMPWRGRGAPGAAAGCCSSISIISRRSTIRWAMPPVTGCCARRRSGCRRRSAAVRRSRGWAVMNSPCCCPMPRSAASRAWRQRSSAPWRQPFSIDGQPARIGASVGYALGPTMAPTLDKLLKSADLALYEVKTNGRGTACRYVPATCANAPRNAARWRPICRWRSNSGELALAFQPVVDAADERIVGFEALLRWNHPSSAISRRCKFIPVAEATGLIIPIGHWVIENACAWAARWPDACARRGQSVAGADRRSAA